MRGSKKIRGLETFRDISVSLGIHDAPQYLQKTPHERKCLAICYRYFYHSAICRLKIEDTVKRMETEFYISCGRIANILKSHSKDIANIRAENPSCRRLAEKYPMYTWPDPKHKRVNVQFVTVD